MGDELQKRIFRCSGRKFDYPVPRSGATRFHGPDSAGVPLAAGPPVSSGTVFCTGRLAASGTRQHEADIEKLENQAYWHPR